MSDVSQVWFALNVSRVARPVRVYGDFRCNLDFACRNVENQLNIGHAEFCAEIVTEVSSFPFLLEEQRGIIFANRVQRPSSRNSLKSDALMCHAQRPLTWPGTLCTSHAV